MSIGYVASAWGKSKQEFFHFEPNNGTVGVRSTIGALLVTITGMREHDWSSTYDGSNVLLAKSGDELSSDEISETSDNDVEEREVEGVLHERIVPKTQKNKIIELMHDDDIRAHPGRDKTYCEECQLKKSSVRKCVVVKRIVSNSMNSRAQVDLIDMQSQPDGKYRFIFNYQDHLTKMICLRALQTKTAEEVAFHLVDIFRGTPILQSDNGREFSNKVIKEVLAMWPECKLVHGWETKIFSITQGSVERANRDVEAILACWMKNNNTTQWSNGLRFVQWQKNTRFHSGIGRTPYEAMYGEKAHLGISAVNIPEEIMEGMETEEQLAEALCLLNEEDQNVEQGRSAESCAINCNS
ncbi:KRAB-A domain-containing protein 2-like [Macrobrachium nipponense]|uniref:KRAB-A domain-containing protein 2-like n=1 Tax=Macrobrachium nipponense TaxID=159736 RepID=UPI0030C7DE9E